VSSGSKAEYRVDISNPAKKDLRGLSSDNQLRIVSLLKALALQPRPDGVKKLKGSGAYRVRCGDYRVVYDIEDQNFRINVLVVRHRSEAYR
jgi:mRNA interferase RelE/StbE